ncbi:MAG: alkyl salicylate esterase [Subtercola sp.]|nr:alkyl salicylate esterase [Subtercola sp.]
MTAAGAGDGPPGSDAGGSLRRKGAGGGLPGKRAAGGPPGSDAPRGGEADARAQADAERADARAQPDAERADALVEATATKPLIVLIHGAWAGSWVWQRLATELTIAGYRTHAVDLPGVGSHPSEPALATLESHVDAVVAAIGVAPRAVLVAHSGGGVIATAVAERMPQRLAGVVYVAGIMLPSGLTFAQLCDEISVSSPDANGIIPYLNPVHIGPVRTGALRTGDTRTAVERTGLERTDLDRTADAPGARSAVGVDGASIDAISDGASTIPGTVVPPEAGVAVFFNRAPAADAVAASRRLGAWPDAVLSPVVTHTVQRFGIVPRLYVEAEFDRSITLAVQRHMQTRTPGAARLTLPSDHAPQLSSPEQLRAGILSFLTALQT